MGTYINVGNAGFQSARNGEYVDKSGLIAVVNSTLFTERRFSCVTRCRRFGKSMAAKMLYAYYDHSCDSRHLFADLQIAHDSSFEKYLNKYPAIYLDMTSFVTRYHDESIVGNIDEWDAICREFAPGTKAMDAYVGWLRRMFKSQDAMRAFACAYMTGILPIKKYRTESALNNFIEYSMVTPRKMARFFGFTKEEVKTLAEKHGSDFGELEKWYDGYQIGDQPSMFNPNSVIQAIDSGWCESYWGKTGSYDAVAHYIKMNYEGLKNDVIQMLGGGRVKVNTSKFQNDMSVIESKGFADMVLIPRKNVDSPAIVLELKVNKDADTAISQIRRKDYPAKLQEYSDRLLLVGINYDRDTKQHTCRIERI